MIPSNSSRRAPLALWYLYLKCSGHSSRKVSRFLLMCFLEWPPVAWAPCPTGQHAEECSLQSEATISVPLVRPDLRENLWGAVKLLYCRHVRKKSGRMYRFPVAEWTTVSSFQRDNWLNTTVISAFLLLGGFLLLCKGIAVAATARQQSIPALADNI